MNVNIEKKLAANICDSDSDRTLSPHKYMKKVILLTFA